jgi:hypothetical protein
MNSNGGTTSKSTPERLVETNAPQSAIARLVGAIGLNSADGLATWGPPNFARKDTSPPPTRGCSKMLASKLTTLPMPVRTCGVGQQTPIACGYPQGASDRGQTYQRHL